MSLRQAFSQLSLAGILTAPKRPSYTIEHFFEKAVSHFTGHEYDREAVLQTLYDMLCVWDRSTSLFQAEALTSRLERVRDSVLRDNPTIRARMRNRDQMGVTYLRESIMLQLTGRGLCKILQESGVRHKGTSRPFKQLS